MNKTEKEFEKELGIIYVKYTKAGTPYLTITIGDKKMVAFQNKFKREDKHPDYRIYPAKAPDAVTNHMVAVIAPVKYVDTPPTSNTFDGDDLF